MPVAVRELMTKLTRDPWRDKVGFSPEVEEAQRQILDALKTESDRLGALNVWIQRYQPCLFGRIAAKSGLLSYCLLTDDELRSAPDEYIAKFRMLDWIGVQEDSKAKKTASLCSRRLSNWQKPRLMKR